MPTSKTIAGLLALTAAVAPAHADDGDTIEAVAAYGPGKTAAEVCAAIPFDKEEGHSDDVSCRQPEKVPKVKLAAPYKKLSRIDRDSSSMGEALLAIETDAGVHLAYLGAWSQDGADHGDIAIKSIKVKDVIPGGAPELLLTGSLVEDSESGPFGSYGTTTQLLWVCGVGASGAPSCLAATIGITAMPDPEERKTYKVKLTHKFEKDGRLTRKLKGKWPRGYDGVTRGEVVNTRTLTFP